MLYITNFEFYNWYKQDWNFDTSLNLFQDTGAWWDWIQFIVVNIRPYKNKSNFDWVLCIHSDKSKGRPVKPHIVGQTICVTKTQCEHTSLIIFINCHLYRNILSIWNFVHARQLNLDYTCDESHVTGSTKAHS